MTILLHDLCGAGDLRFSPYCARVKMALALKGVAYTTTPVAFREIAGIGDGSFRTVPVIRDGDRWIADSFAIACHLDDSYPGPQLFPGGGASRAAARWHEATLGAMVHIPAMPMVALSIHDGLQPGDRAYFRESREARLGRSLEAAAEDRATRIVEYRKTAFLPFRHVLSRFPYLGGDAPTFLDCMAYGSLHWLHAVSDLDWFGGDDVLQGWFDRCRAETAKGAPS